jgi:hypothetical protein
MPGVESGVREGVMMGFGAVGEGIPSTGGESDIGSARVGMVERGDAATLARIALERLERGDVEAVAALLRVLGRD